MVESVGLRKLALTATVMKRSGKAFVRLGMVTTCQAKNVCERNTKRKSKEGFSLCSGQWNCHALFAALK